MSLTSAEFHDRVRFEKRLRLLKWLAFFIFLILTSRMAQWTILRHQQYEELARNNYVHPQRLEAPRGQIFSRDGKPLAVNRLTYSIWVSPFRLSKEELHKTIVYLEDVLGRDLSEKEEAALALRPRWKWQLIARNLPIELAAPILERKWELPGIRITTDFKRYYPEGTVTASIVGYVGRLSNEKMPSYLEKGYTPDDLVGIAGIENSYEDLLRGEAGSEIVQRDARGRYVDTLETSPAVPGHDLYLSLDLDFQKFAYYKLEGRNGTIIVMNPANGNVLVMTCYPTYDSNEPGAPPRPTRPVSYLNKAIQEIYPPASTFKLVTAMAGLDAGINPQEEYDCEGSYTLPDWKKPFVCELPTGHGRINMRNAIKESCNVYFYQIARKIGASRLLQWAILFGYGLETDIDLPFEVGGKLPLQSPDSIPTGELLYMGIGQGPISATPLQSLISYCIFANEGRLVQPHLLLNHKDAEGHRTEFVPKTRDIAIPSESRRIIMDGLRGVVSSGGTAFQAGFSKEWKVAGKTGTAERPGRENDAWFICFAPYDAPEVAALVLIEEGGYGGATAAPLARDMLDYYFQNRTRLLGQ